jgi:uncharacterized protein (TIGR02118 family)
MHRLIIQYVEPADPAAFEQRYAEEHVALVQSIPGLRRFLLTHPRPLGTAAAGPAPYLVAELWFDDATALKAALTSPEMAETGAHAAALGVPTTMFIGDVAEPVGFPG